MCALYFVLLLQCCCQARRRRNHLGVTRLSGRHSKFNFRFFPMRKQTLGSICFSLSLAIYYLFRYLANSQGIQLPLIGPVSPMIASFIIMPLLLVPLTALNQYILAWRKAHGRDIVEEEKHEFGEADIISLRPRQPHEHSSTHRGFRGCIEEERDN